MALGFLLDDDIFVSYSRLDGSTYAVGLADALAKMEFSCFLDKLGTDANPAPPETLFRRIRGCKLLVLLGTEGAVASAPITREVEEFAKANGTSRIVTISFDRGGSDTNWTEAGWHAAVTGLARERESAESLATGAPAPYVISRIEKQFNYMKSKERLRKYRNRALTLFLILVSGSVGAGALAYVKSREAIGAVREAATARAEADRLIANAREDVRTAQELVVTSRGKAEQADAKRVEAERLTDEARLKRETAEREARRQEGLARKNGLVANERLVDMSQEQGRLELLRNNKPQALVYLNDAYGHRPGDEPLRFLVAAARKSLIYTLPTYDKPPERMATVCEGMDVGFGCDLYHVAYSSDGRAVITASGSDVKVWDATDGRLLRKLKGSEGESPSEGWAEFATFVSEGKQILTRQRKTMRLWDAVSGRLIRTTELQVEGEVATTNGELTQLSPDEKRMVIPGDTAMVFDVESGRKLYVLASDGGIGARNFAAFSPDGKRLITIYHGAKVSLWNAVDGKLLFTLEEKEGINSALFSPNGRAVVTADNGGEAKVWDVMTGKATHTIKAHEGGVSYAAFSPDGSRVATAGADKTIKLWRINEDSQDLVLTLSGNEAEVSSFAFSPSGRRLASVSKLATPNEVKLWDLEGGRLLDSFIEQANAVLFSSDGETFLTANSLNEVKIHNAAKDLFLDTLTDNESVSISATYSPDGSRIATVDAGGKVRVWDAASKRQLRVFESSEDNVTPQTFSPDGRLVILPGAGDGANIWEVDSGRLRRSLEGHGGRVTSAAFSPDGLRLVTTAEGPSSKIAKIWNAANGRLVRTLTSEDDLDFAFFGPDGNLVLAGSSKKKRSNVWEGESGAKLAQTIYGSNPAFSSDSRRVVTHNNFASIGGGGLIYEAAVWDPRGKVPALEIKHETVVHSASFSPDGRSVLTGVGDGTARLWDAHTGKPLRTFAGHMGAVTFAAFSPEGGRVVTAGQDRVLKIWDAARGQTLFSLVGHFEEVEFAAFGPDGRSLVSLSKTPDVSERGSVKVWDVSQETKVAKNVDELIIRWVSPEVLNTVVRQTFH